MQSPAEFSREHQPAYVPATNRVLAGFLTMGVYALVLVVASHRSPVPSRAAPPEFAAMERGAQPIHPEAPPQTQAAPQSGTQQAPRNRPALSQQTALRQPSLLERLFGTTAPRVPTMTSGGAPSAPSSSAAASAPAEQSAAQPSSRDNGSASASSSAASRQQGDAEETRDKQPACYDAAWARAIANRLRPFYSAAAHRQQASGKATARLVIRRSGWLNELEIATTSGNTALDAAAYAMLRNAQPLPRIPDRIAADRIDLALLIAFGGAGDSKITINGCDH